MSAILDVIIAACLTNPDSRQSQGCKHLVEATYIQYHFENNSIDKQVNFVLDNVNKSLPASTKFVILAIDAINNQRVYVPLVNKEF